MPKRPWGSAKRAKYDDKIIEEGDEEWIETVSVEECE
jgi:hypothetical protein